MLKFRNLFALAAMTLAFVGASAADLVVGKDYQLVSPAQPTEKGKIEVIEFFSYMCPHCYQMDPFVSKWQQTLAKDVVFIRVPVVFRAQWEAPAKLYYSLDALGELDKLHPAAFAAIHQENGDLTNEANVTNWVVKKGLDRKKFSDTFNSFTVQSKAQGGKQKQGAYGISGVPAFVVAGKYRSPDNYPGSFDTILKLVDDLIVKARLEQGKK